MFEKNILKKKKRLEQNKSIKKLNKHKLAIATLAVIITAGTGAFAIGRASADTSTQPSLIQMIAQKFGLNQSDVQAVVTQYRQERQAQMEANFKAKLDADVTAGKITAAQETLIINERQSLQSERTSQAASFKTMTPAQRQAAMQKNRADLTAWAKQNNIDVQYLFGGFGRMGMGKGIGANSSQSSN